MGYYLIAHSPLEFDCLPSAVDDLVSGQRARLGQVVRPGRLLCKTDDSVGGGHIAWLDRPSVGEKWGKAQFSKDGDNGGRDWVGRWFGLCATDQDVHWANSGISGAGSCATGGSFNHCRCNLGSAGAVFARREDYERACVHIPVSDPASATI